MSQISGRSVGRPSVRHVGLKADLQLRGITPHNLCVHVLLMWQTQYCCYMSRIPRRSGFNPTYCLVADKSG